MSKSEYFLALAAALPADGYKQRFLSELEGHFNDAQAEYSLTGRSSEKVETDIQSNLGDPKDLAKDYKQTMRQLNPKNYYLELIFIAVVSVPVYIITWWCVQSIMALGLVYPIILILLLPLFYYLTIDSDLFEPAVRRKTIAYLIALPGLGLLTIGLIMVSDVIDGDKIMRSTSDYWQLASEGLSLISVIAYGIYSMYLSQRIKRWRQALIVQGRNKVKSRPKYYFAASMSSLCIGYIICTTILMWRGPDQFNAYLNGLLMPRQLFEFLLMVFPALALFMFSTYIGNLILGGVLIGLVLLCLHSFYHYFREKKSNRIIHWPWFKTVLLVYLICLLFCGPSGRPDIDWKVPSDDWSWHYEQQKLGPLFRFVKYQNREEGRYGRYQIGLVNNQLAIQVLDDASVKQTIIFNEINSVDNYKTANANENYDFITGDLSKLPDDFTCTNYQQYTEDQVGCDQLMFNGKDLYISNYKGVRIVTDPQQEFALFKVGTGAYDPEYVYLVDLRD